MRLINLNTRKLESFFGNSIPPYAILSHTWGNDNEELSFADIQRDDPPAIHSIKVAGCLRQARRDGLRHAWIDTCCIDKTNSVELNEAINSMFRWYEEAKVCYVYLAECTNPVLPEDEPGKLPHSSWFRRGWTLQELVAPKELRVYDQMWHLIGDRRAIAPSLSRLTGIPIAFLAKYRPLREASVAQRMSWASSRVTKREEDIAYCLLGIFGITMTMNYGEQGTRAFQRLQRKILDEIDDDSILAWGLGSPAGPNTSNGEPTYTSALATSPSDFLGCGRVIAFAHDRYSERPVFAPGHIQVHGIVVRQHPADTDDATRVVLLRCGIAQRRVIAIPLAWTKRNGVWGRPERARVLVVELQKISSNLQAETIKVGTTDGRQASGNAGIASRFFIDTSAVDLQLVEVYPKEYWEAEQQSIVVKDAGKDKPTNHIIIMRLTSPNQAGFQMIAFMDVWTGKLSGYPRSHPMGKYAVMSCSGYQHDLEDFFRCYRYLRRESKARTAFFPLGNLAVSMHVEKIEDDPVTILLVRLVAKEMGEEAFMVDAREELQLAYREMAKDLERVMLENSWLKERVSALEETLEERTRHSLGRVSALEAELERNKGEMEKVSALEAERVKEISALKAERAKEKSRQEPEGISAWEAGRQARLR
ncbi:heterokaryon incompatibility protein-domain-containing protein [Podospora conica]|nr:heterokaryon incompatibility protein-domain-containing protein [Schizothecium conicum]